MIERQGRNSEGTAPFYGPEHIVPLTGLRGIAASMVVVYHFHAFSTPQNAAHETVLAVIKSFGIYGVATFFALSGYILTEVYFERLSGSISNTGRFLWRRLVRIYPLHLVVLLFLVVVFPKYSSQPGSTIDTFISHLFLVHGWGFAPPSWDWASWSISIEFFWYLVFPVLVFLLRWKFFPFVLLAACLVAMYNLGPISRYLNPEWQMAGFGGGYMIVFYGFYFLMGVSLRGIESVAPKMVGIWRHPLPIAGVIGFIAFGPFMIENTYRIMLSLVFLSVAIPAVRYNPLAAAFLSLPAVAGLGQISYSLYLSHNITRAMLGGIPGIKEGWPFWLGLYVLVVIISITLFECVEKPARNWGKAKLRVYAADRGSK